MSAGLPQQFCPQALPHGHGAEFEDPGRQPPHVGGKLPGHRHGKIGMFFDQSRKRCRGSMAILQAAGGLDAGRARQAIDRRNLAKHAAGVHFVKAYPLPVGGIEVHMQLAGQQEKDVECRVIVADHQFAGTEFAHRAGRGKADQSRLRPDSLKDGKPRKVFRRESWPSAPPRDFTASRPAWRDST